MGKFMVLSWNLLGGAEESHDPPTKKIVSWLKFEPGTSRMQYRNDIA